MLLWAVSMDVAVDCKYGCCCGLLLGMLLWAGGAYHAACTEGRGSSVGALHTQRALALAGVELVPVATGDLE